MTDVNLALNQSNSRKPELREVEMQRCPESVSFITDSLRARMDAMLAQIEPLRAQSADAVHDMRVASRRMRAALSEFSPWLNETECNDFLNRTRTITRLLGRPRELDVMLEMLAKFKLQLKGPWLDAADHALAAIEKSRKKAAPQIVEALEILEAQDFQNAFERLLKTCSELRGCLLRNPPERLKKRLKKLRNTHKQWQETEDEPHLHQVRIAYKKLRYTCELYEPLYGEEMRKLIKNLKHMQEALGDWNDWRVLRDEVEAVSHNASYRAVQGFPLLVEQLDVQCRRHLNKFEHGSKDFKSMLKQAQKFFETPLASCCLWKESG